MKKTVIMAAASMALLVSGCGRQQSEPLVDTDNDVILHAWSWSFNSIAENMRQIADAGFGYVQTSPANTCFVGENGGKALFSQPGDSITGKWYYYYQPIDWQVGNYLLGTEDELIAMCDSARKYGVKVIVDVLPNHTAVDHTAVTAAMDSAVGGHEKLFHANGFTPITQWNDRYECTTGQMGGLPDVNTENPDFQYYYMQYVNRLLADGVRGFRYDTAKHIGLPSDPLDSLAERNNFWLVALGMEPVKDQSLAIPADSLFIYGEVLQDKNVKEDEYAELMRVTASNYGHSLREALDSGCYNDNLADWQHKAHPSRLVTWVESHDTYANAHESAHLTDDQIRQGYVFLTARANGTPLFFSRPDGSTRDNYWGNNLVGPRGNAEFYNPEVTAINKFRTVMAGQPENVVVSDNRSVVEIERGKKGIVLVNLSTEPQTVDMPTVLPDAHYKDQVHGCEFKVSSGRITGNISPVSSYIIYKD